MKYSNVDSFYIYVCA